MPSFFTPGRAFPALLTHRTTFNLLDTWDATVALSGVQAQSAAGILGVIFQCGLIGVSATSSVGTPSVSFDVPLTGQSATGGFGTQAVTFTIGLTGVSATSSVGINSTGDSCVLPGCGSTGNVGTPGVNFTIGLIGVSATSDVGTLTPSSDTVLGLTGVSATSAVSTPSPLSFDVSITGLSATSDVGTLSPGIQGDITLELPGVGATSAVGLLEAPPPQVINEPLFIAGGQARRKSPIEKMQEARHFVTVQLNGVSAAGRIGKLTPSYQVVPTAPIILPVAPVVEAAQEIHEQPVVVAPISEPVALAEEKTAVAVGNQVESMVGTLAPSINVQLEGVQSKSDVGELLPSQVIPIQAAIEKESPPPVQEEQRVEETQPVVISISGVQASSLVGQLSVEVDYGEDEDEEELMFILGLAA